MQSFHSNSFINYQLIRLHGEGFADDGEIREAAADIRSIEDVERVFKSLSLKAEGEGRLKNAAFYARIQEFFTPPKTPDRKNAYKRFVGLFDQAFCDEGLERHTVKYKEGYLPVIRLGARGTQSKGMVLVCGGFDSLIEEFYRIWRGIAEAGFDVIAFEGPGQGGARALHDLPFEHDWEAPVGAILDHFKIEKAALVGISMGGYWVMRAAAFDPRIQQVVAWPPVYDWLETLPRFLRPLVHWMVSFRCFMNWSIRFRMRLSTVLHHAVEQALYIQNKEERVEVANWLLGMNKKHICSERVKQNVLLLVGQEDAFQSPRLAKSQANALVNASSVTTRIFTSSEGAAGHCQMGNLPLATQVLTDWLTARI